MIQKKNIKEVEGAMPQKTDFDFLRALDAQKNSIKVPKKTIIDLIIKEAFGQDRGDLKDINETTEPGVYVFNNESGATNVPIIQDNINHYGIAIVLKNKGGREGNPISQIVIYYSPYLRILFRFKWGQMNWREWTTIYTSKNI